MNPPPIATDAAAAAELMLAASIAVTLTAPDVVSTSAPAMAASTWPSIVLVAIVTPIETAAPTLSTPIPTATDIAPANAVMDEAFSASSVTLAACVGVRSVPRMLLLTSTPMLFSEKTPDPLAAIPAAAPPASAAEPARTNELIP